MLIQVGVEHCANRDLHADPRPPAGPGAIPGYGMPDTAHLQ